jgi:hypothetical protein
MLAYSVDFWLALWLSISMDHGLRLLDRLHSPFQS